MGLKKELHLCYFLFYLSTWMSKTVFPIHWEQKGKLGLYALSYSFMSAAGLCSIFLPWVIKRLHFKHFKILGVLLFSLGLFLRAFPLNASLAIVSGVFSGLGSSFLILSFKSYTIQFEEPERSNLISWNVSYSKIAQLIGSVCSGYLVVFFALFYETGYEIALCLAALPILFVLLMLPEKNQNTFTHKQQTSLLPLFREKPFFMLSVTFTVFLAGFYQASLTPLIPLYLKDGGIVVEQIGFILSLGLIIGVLFNSLLSRKSSPSFASTGYFLISLVSSICLIGYVLPTNWYLLVFSAVVYLALRTVASTFSNTIEMNLVDPKYLAAFFGFLSTTFLISDIFGGAISAYVFNHRENPLLVLTMALLTVCNGIFYMLTFKKGAVIPETLPYQGSV